MSFELPLTINLKDFTAALGTVKTGLASIAQAPAKALGAAFGPAIQGVQKFAAGIQQAQLAIGAASVAVGAGIREAVNAYNEGQSAAAKVSATFGANAETVNAAIQGIAQSTDRSKADLQGMAAQFGVLIGVAGQTKQKTAELSAQFTQTAVDIAARFGRPVEGVFEAIDSALKGREQGVKEFGIVLSDVAKETEARRLGFNPDDLNEQQTALINLNIITAQTAQFQGAAANASGTLRDSMRRVTDQTKELYTAIGGALEPALSPLVDKIVNVIKNVRGWIEANPQLAASIGTAVVAFAAFGTALASVGAFIAYGLPLLSAMAAPFAALLNPVSALIVGFTTLLGATAIGGAIDGIAKFIANGQGVKVVVDAISQAVSAIGGAFDVLKAGISQIGSNVFKRLEADAGGAGEFFSTLGTRISTALTAAFEFILPIAQEIVTQVIDIFEGIPTVVDAIGETFKAFGSFFSDVVSIIIGDTSNVGVGFDDLQSTATGVVAFLGELFKAPALITALGAIRLALAGVVAGMGFLYEGAQLVVAGIELLFAKTSDTLQLVLDGLGKVSTTAKGYADEFRAFNDALIQDGVARSEKAQAQIGAIATKLATETSAALDQINDPGALVKRLKTEQTERQKTLAIAKTMRTEEAARNAEHVKGVAAIKSQGDAIQANTVLSKKQKEEIKSATAEAVQAELAVLDARAKANGLLSEEMALLERRRQIELQAARDRFASTEELAQINRKFNAEALGMIEERKRAEKAARQELADFAAGKSNDRLGRSGNAKDQDLAAINRIAGENAGQIKNVTDSKSALDAKQSLTDELSKIPEEIKGKIKAIIEEIKTAEPDKKESLRDELAGLYDRLGAATANIDDAKKRQAKAIGSQLSSNAADNAAAGATDQNPNGGGGVDAASQSPIDQAKTVLQGLGEKFSALAEQLGTKLEAFNDQVVSLVTATASLVKAGDAFPKLSAGLETVIANETGFGDALASTFNTVTTQLEALAAAIASNTRVLKTQEAKIKANDAIIQASRDTSASMGDY